MNNDIFSLTGFNIWVIGGAGYLGQPIVKQLVNLGAKVVCFDLNDRAYQFVKSNNLTNFVTPLNIQIKEESEIVEFVKEMIKTYGLPQGVVNLSYASTSKSMEYLSKEDFDHTNETITTTFLLTREVGKQMSEQKKGSIVLFSSMYGNVSPYPDVYEGLGMNKNPIEYGVGKAAIVQMTKYLAVHWGKRNVRCNCTHPALPKS